MSLPKKLQNLQRIINRISTTKSLNGGGPHYPKLMECWNGLETASPTLVAETGRWHIPTSVLRPTNGPIRQAQGTLKQQPAACLSMPLQLQVGRDLRLANRRTEPSSCLPKVNGKSYHLPWTSHAFILGLGFLVYKMNVLDGDALSTSFQLTGSACVTQRLAWGDDEAR